MPVITISVCVGVATLMPLGIWGTTGCEKPSDRLSLSPCACAREPTPTSERRFAKPLVTPATMLATSARMVPDIALAWFELPSALNTTCSPSCFTSTFGSVGRAMVPSGPFTEMLPLARVRSTPFGSGIGYLAMRDMALSLSDDAEHFAADTVSAGLAIGHHAARGREDRHAQPVHHARDVIPALVDAQPRFRDALDALDHRPAGVVLEADGELLLGAAVFTTSAARSALNFSTVLRRFLSRNISASLAIGLSSVLEREAERGEQCARLVVGLRRGGDGDVHAAQGIDLVVIDLGEDDLFLEAEVVVAAAVERAVRHAAEVTDARHRDVHQAVEELVHARAAQRHHAAHREVGAHLEVGDRFARLRHHRLLPGDLGHVGHRVVEHLLVGGGFAHPHVDRDLLDARHLHDALVAELLRELGHHLLAVELREARRRRRLLGCGRLGRRGVLLRRFLFALRLRLLGGLLLARRRALVALLRLRVVFLVVVLGHYYASTCSPLPLKTRTLRPSAMLFTPARSAFCVAGL